MKEALLLAKGLALQEGLGEITQEKFLGALHYCDIQGKKPVVRKLLARRRDDVEVESIKENASISVGSLIDEARRAAPLPLTADLKDLLTHLRLNSVTIQLKRLEGEAVSRPQALVLAEHIKRSLTSSLKGQQTAVDAIVSYMATRDSKRKTGVRGVFVFAGPPASGKSYAAQLLADNLGDYHLWSYDCSCITSVLDRSVLDGNPSSIMGSKPGEMTDFVRRNPQTVIVLEHFDRMQPAVQDILLPLLETGFLKDMYGFYKTEGSREKTKIADSVVDFRHVYLILTVESGAEVYQSAPLLASLREGGGDAQVRTALVTALASARNEQAHPPGNCFSPSLLSRLEADGLPVLFPPLGWQALRDVCRQELRAAIDLFAKRMQPIGVQVPEEEFEALATMLLLAEGGQADARRVNRERLQERLFGALTSRWIDGQVLPRIVTTMGAKTLNALDEIVVDLGDEPIRALFRSMRRLVYDVQFVDAAESGITTFCLANPRLVKAVSGGDFQGEGALLVELPDVRLIDVAGHARIKESLQRQVVLLRDNRMLSGMGLKPPGGMLLHGLPGTGKTTLARAFAGEAGLPFIAVTGPQLLDLHFQKKIFQKLRSYAPAILFVDELDTLGRRGGGFDPAINALLAELDGFSSSTGESLFVIGATNFKEKIDPALTRPGRLELVFETRPPGREARRMLLQRIEDRLTDGLSEALLDYSKGMSGAQIEAASREMVLHQGPVDEQTARTLLESQVFGESIAEGLDQEQRQNIAYHEAGHVVVMLAVGGRVVYASLTARESSYGHIAWEDRSMGAATGAADVKAHLAAVLGGRVAQHIFRGDETGGTGAASDLELATRMAYNAISRLGLDSEVGPVSMPMGKDPDMPMPGLIRQVERRVRVWLAEAEQMAGVVLREHWAEVEALAGELLVHGGLGHSRLMEVVAMASGNTQRPACRSKEEV